MTNLLFASSPEISGADVTLSARILVVEDEWLMAQGLKENLETLGHEVMGLAASGEEAIRLATERRPDLVLMDINLKGDMDGIDTASRLRSLEVPIIFLTAYADEQTLGRAKLVEPFGYILKPFEVRELRSAVEIALYKSQAEKRLLHLNLVLRAIRSIGQLIIQEKAGNDLIQRACQILTESRGYHSAWMVLLGGDGRVAATATSGLYSGREVLPGLEQGKLPPCGLQALAEPGLLVVEDLTISCADCFWWSDNGETGALVTRLAHQDTVYGVLGVQLLAARARDEEELVLFRELASDLSFALYKIDLENRAQKALLALESSEAKYRQIVETANEGIWVINENFLTTFVNRQMAALLDCLPEEVLGRPLTDFMFSEDRADNQEKMTQRRYGQAGLYERRLRTRKGREVWTLVSGTPVQDEEGRFKGSFGMFMDITERKRAEEALVRAKDEWELTFDSVPEMIAILDREQTIVNLNQPMAAALGTTKEQARGRKCYELVHGLLRAPGFCPFIHLLQDKQSHSVQVFEEKLGAFLQVSVSPLFDREENLQGCVHVVQDITELKKAEAAAREQFIFLETLIDTIPNPIFYKDMSGKYLGCNLAFEKFTGIAKEKIVERTAKDLPCGDLAQACHQMDLELFQQLGERVQETSVSHADGTLHEVIFYKASFPKADGNIGGLVGVMLDITQRKQTEEDLKKIQSQQQAILDNIPDIVWLKDKEGKYIAANEPFGKTCGVRPKDLVGKTDLDLWPRDLAEKYRQDDGNVMKTATRQSYEEPIVNQAGEIIQIETIKSPIYNDRGKVIGTCGIARDITQRKKAEADLQRAHQEIEQLFLSIPFIMIGLSPDGRILQWNPEAERALWPLDKPMTGKKLDEYDLSWEWDKVLPGMEQCRETGLTTRLEDTRYQRPDGKDGFLGITFSPIRGEHDQIVGLILQGRDITRQRHLQVQLAQAQKLESIGQLAAGIAHEINTPIQYVGDNIRFLTDAFGDVGQLMRDYGQALAAVERGSNIQEVRGALASTEQQVDLEYLMDEIPRALEQSQDGVERVAKIVRAMKDFSHPGTGEKTAVNINQAIENTIMVARNEWKYVAEVETDLDAGLPLVSCLPDEFNQVLLNLIINAAHAIGEVVGSDGCRKGVITLSTHLTGDGVEIRVQDTGTGIPEKIKARIFDPFFTTKQVGKGTGQGLAIAHSVIVDKHGGTISFETEVDRGTTFIIRLPLEDSGG